MSNHFKLGQKLRDRVSGFEGIAESRCEFLSGCVRYGIQPRVSEDKPESLPDGKWFDLEQLEFVDNGVCEDIDTKPSGGERDDPPLRHAAT